MVRPWRLLAQVAGVGALILAFPAASWAPITLIPIRLTATGPSPASLTVVIGDGVPFWENTDTVTHTVTFADGLCSLQVAPGQIGRCPIPWQVGQYTYTVDGSAQASITFLPEGRSVTLTAKSHMIKQGAHLLLHGLLNYGTGSIPPGPFTDTPVMVLARPDRHHPFQQIATAATGRLESHGGGWPWWLGVHPTRTTIYIAEATDQPELGQVWTNATSKPFRVVVRR
jgi:hypothetical protein